MSNRISVEALREDKRILIKFHEGTDHEFNFTLSADEVTPLIKSLASASMSFPVQIPDNFDNLTIPVTRNTRWQVKINTPAKQLFFIFFHHAFGPFSYIIENKEFDRIVKFFSDKNDAAIITKKKTPQKTKKLIVGH
jgi:hypothetical protein